MYTNHKQAMRMGGVWLMLLAGPVLAPGADAATNETVSTNMTAASTNSVAADIKIDKALKALNPPVLQPVLYPPDEAKGAPVWSLYKEQPPAAQQDFRPPKPVEVPKPREEEPRDEPDPNPEPPPAPQPPPPPPIPCTPNHPNWPNC